MIGEKSTSFSVRLVTTTSTTEDPLKSINYQRLLTNYTEKCRHDTELWQIVNYFYLLKQIRQKDGENCFIESLAILLTKSNENDVDNLLERLFGVNRQGALTEVNRSNEAKEERRRRLVFQARILDHLDIDTNVVTANVATYLEKRGDLEMAAVLYDRAKVFLLHLRLRIRFALSRRKRVKLVRFTIVFCPKRFER